MVAPGKIMIQKIAVDEYDGVELSEETQDTFGTVISIGRPQLKMYFWWEIFLWWFGKHPFPFKVGSRVLVPRGGRCHTLDGKEFHIFNQDQILCNDQI